MKIISACLIFLTFISFNTYSQCFSSSGIGDFEGANLTTNYIAADQGNGSLSVSSEDKLTGNQSLKVVVTQAGVWEVRLYNNGNCTFNKAPKESYTVSFYLKGDVGDVVNVSIMDNTTVDQTTDVTITSANWTLYKVNFQSSTTSTQGRIKLIFTDAGTYFVDDLQVNAFDCHGDAGGNASFDDCSICSEGNTGLTAINSCTLESINPTDPKFVYEGVLESDITTSKAAFYRMKKDYVTTEVSGYYGQTRAAASSGIGVLFKTQSPKMHIYFQENLTLGDDVYWHTFDVFKDGVFQFATNDLDFELENPTGQSVEWKITLPTFSAIEFVKLDVITGFPLETVSNTNKPVYIAIGNSITHGRGIDINSTRLGYPFIIADSLNYELYNWGIGGSKIYDGVLTNLSSGIQPDLVTVLWGYNDVHYSQSDDHFATSTFPMYTNIIETMARDYPSACVMAILPTFTLDSINTSVRNIDSLRSGQLSIIKNLQQTYSNISFMHGTDYSSASGLGDDVHLNEAGNQSLAYGVLNELPCSQITGEKDIIVESIHIYPNPTTDRINWEKHQNYKLTDLNGRIIYTGYGTNLDLEKLVKGTYLIQIGNKTQKIIKNQ